MKELSEFIGFPIGLYVEKLKEKGMTDLEKMVHGEVKRGTKIIFDLKEEESKFLGVRRLTDLVMKLSEFIGFPIEFHVEKSQEKEVTDSGKNEDDYRGGR